MSRKSSREMILQALYSDEFYFEQENPRRRPLPIQKIFKEKQLSVKDETYITEILAGIWKKKIYIDELIEKTVQNWKTTRISLVDLNILRIAIYEMLFYPSVPEKVALNEAIELAKKFGEKNTSIFINGILNQILKQKEKR